MVLHKILECSFSHQSTDDDEEVNHSLGRYSIASKKRQVSVSDLPGTESLQPLKDFSNLIRKKHLPEHVTKRIRWPLRQPYLNMLRIHYKCFLLILVLTKLKSLEPLKILTF